MKLLQCFEHHKLSVALYATLMSPASHRPLYVMFQRCNRCFILVVCATTLSVSVAPVLYAKQFTSHTNFQLCPQQSVNKDYRVSVYSPH